MQPAEWNAFVERWAEACRDDPQLPEFLRGEPLSFVLASGPDRVLVQAEPSGALVFRSDLSADDSWDFSLVAPAWVWEKYWQPEPPPLFHSLFAMLMRVPEFHLEGSMRTFAQMAAAVRRIVEAPRRQAGGERPSAAPQRQMEGVEPIVGRYLNLMLGSGPSRIYFEQSGEGDDLLLLHTAGADSRQYHHLLCAPELRSGWRMTAFDLPLHGRSQPVSSIEPWSYRLTTEAYVDTVMRVSAALGLRRPVVVGSSMAGEICLELAYRYPGSFRAVVACEASDHVGGRKIGWAKHPAVNQAAFVPEWVYGLMAPGSPLRDEVWWGYSQGGYGVFHGDIEFYSGDWDARDHVGAIDTGRCPVYMLTGEYDYSCRPEDSERTAAKIPGARFRVMHGLGHFPMAENPERFLGYLLPVLEEVSALG